MILDVENKKKKQKTLSELKSNYSKVAGYKDNMKKAIAFLCTSNEKLEFEILKKSYIKI